MQVIIFKNITNERNPSMQLYAQELLKNMPPNVEGFSISAKNYPLIKYYFTKEFIYPKVAAKNQADVNHISDHSYSGLLKYLDPKRTVATCHDLIPLIDSDSVPWLGKRRFWYNVKFLPRAKRIIVSSEFTKQTIINLFKNITEDTIDVIPYGVSSIFRPLERKPELRIKYNIDKKSILHIGSSYLRKNVELILEVLSRRKNWQFIKVGPFSKGQLDYIKKRNLRERILHFPFIDLTEREKLAEIYNSVGVLVYPSFYEGFGIPVLEAMACGCPVICSEIPPFVEIAKEAAVFFNPHHAKALESGIERVLEDKSFKNNLVQKGFSTAKRYNWKDCARNTYKIYEEIYNQIQ